MTSETMVWNEQMKSCDMIRAGSKGPSFPGEEPRSEMSTQRLDTRALLSRCITRSTASGTAVREPTVRTSLLDEFRRCAESSTYWQRSWTRQSTPQGEVLVHELRRNLLIGFYVSLLADHSMYNRWTTLCNESSKL